MSGLELLQVVAYFVLLLITTPLLGVYMAHVFNDDRTLLTPLLRPIESDLYSLAGVKPSEEQGWKGYALALVAFNGVGFVVV